MRPFQRFRLALTLLAILLTAGPVRATITVLNYWHMGENDPGAVSGGHCTNTLDAVGKDTLTNTTVGGLSLTYTSAVSPAAAADASSTLALTLANSNYLTGAVATNLANNFGIECWVKPGATVGGQILAYNGLRGNGWGLYQAGANYEVLYGGLVSWGSAVATAGTWMHLALVRNNGVAVLYTNGVPASTNSSATPLTPTTSFTVGGDAQYSEYFTGSIDEVRVFTFAPGAFSTNDLLLNSPYLTVFTTNDSGPGSLRQAVLTAAAFPGTGTIAFETNLSGQVIWLTNGPIVLSNNVTIDAGALANGIQINPNYQSRVFTVNNATVVLNSLTLTNGNAQFDKGGSILNNSGIVTVNNCFFTENAAYDGAGGAIANTSGAMTVNNCTFAYNFATITTGYSSSGNTGGGAIYNAQGHLTVNGCTFMDNYGDGGEGGGAIWCTGAFPVTANNCTFAGNSATNAGTGGGAICDQSGAAVAVNNCTFVSNTATNSSLGGGGIYTSGNLSLTNSIIASNSAATGAHVYCGGVFTEINSLISVGSGSAVPSLIYYHNGFISSGEVDTTNALLAPLDNYGGPTQTMLPLPGSPAIDAGTDSVTNFLTTDQRGLPRKTGAHVDIGAVEVQPGDTNTLVTTTADSGSGSLRFAAFLVNFGVTNRITFSNTLSGQTILLTSGQIVLSSNVTIDASSLTNGIQINGNNHSRIFEISNNATVVLNSLTLTNGNDNNDPNYGGGGILNFGTLTVTNCVFTGNQANGITDDGEPTGGNGGGGIYSPGTLTVNNSTFTGNQANDVYDGGGGIFNYEGTLTVNNSTFTGNQAKGTDGGGGGGILCIFGSLTVNNSTFTANQADYAGGGINANSRLTNCIFYANTANYGDELSGNITIANCLLGPESYTNSVDTAHASYTLINSVTNANPLLAPLGNYGGPTQTMPPEPGSPAIDAGTDSVTSFLTTDQRGLPRKSGAHVDIGAVEDQSGQYYSIVENTLDAGPGSLRQVISNAPAGATVTFVPSLSGQIITLTSGQIVLSNSVYIYGTGLSNGVLINGNGTSRIFQVNSGTTAIMEYLTLTNGNPGSANFGGAILNASGTLLELAACTLANNSSGQGGAIENEGTCVLLECTITGNHAVTTGGVSGNGGAIDNNQGPLQLLQCTIVSNTASVNGGGVANFLTTLAITNSIIANNSPQDTYNFASSTINAGGTNIVISESAQGGSTNNGSGSLLGLAPMLASLGNYGGLTPTMPPLRGSPAIDGGSAAAEAAEGFTVDQRGYPRVSGTRVDIGAVEVQIADAPFSITELPSLENGLFQFDLPNLVGGSFTVFATTNLTLPFNTWSNLGPVLETPPGSGVFQFTDTHATNFSRRFYRVSSP